MCVKTCVLYFSHIGATEEYFGRGEGPIHLDDVACNGTESRLIECAAQTKHDCTHLEDAGVVCTGTSYLCASSWNSSNLAIFLVVSYLVNIMEQNGL